MRPSDRLMDDWLFASQPDLARACVGSSLSAGPMETQTWHNKRSELIVCHKLTELRQMASSLARLMAADKRRARHHDESPNLITMKLFLLLCLFHHVPGVGSLSVARE